MGRSTSVARKETFKTAVNDLRSIAWNWLGIEERGLLEQVSFQRCLEILDSRDFGDYYYRLESMQSVESKENPTAFKKF